MDKGGTLLVYGTFDPIIKLEINSILDVAREKEFDLVVFYPQNNETLQRMGIPVKKPYYSRVDQLHEFLSESTHPMLATIDEWEGHTRKKKYTPLELSIRFLTDKYKGPHFVYLTNEYALKAASYDSFNEWIRHVRLLIRGEHPLRMDEKLMKYKHRWEVV